MIGNRITKPVEYPHTAISSFIGTMKDYFTKYVYTKFGYAMVGSFDKAIQYIDQMQNPEITRERDMAHLYPFIVYTPNLEEPDRFMDFLWQYHGMGSYLAMRNHRPIIFEDGSALSIILRRMKGNIDVKIFAESQMELHDIQMAFLNHFHGLNTYTVLNNIDEFFILGEQIKLFRNDREVKVLNLKNSTLEKRLVQSINKEEYTVPISAAPLLQLTSMSDSSSFFGGSGLTDYALSGNITFELDVPANVVLQTDLEIDDMSLTIDFISGHRPYGPPRGIVVSNLHPHDHHDDDHKPHKEEPKPQHQKQ